MQQRRRGPGRWATAVPALLLALASLLGPGGASPAAAHDELTASEPADGATVSGPTQLVLTFSSDQLDLGAVVEVTGPDGAAWADGAPAVAGNVVTQPLRPGAPAGAYAVRWRSVSGDGHPIEGALTYTVEEAPDAPDAEPAPEASEPAPTQTAEPAPAPPEDTVAPAPDAATTPDDPSGAGPVVWLTLAAAAVVGLVVVLVLRGRRRGEADR